MSSKAVSLLLAILFLCVSISYSQEDPSLTKEGAPNVFIDCGYCDLNYIKEQIPIVNYVRDRKDANVHVLFTSQRTGSGGNNYTLFFIGLNNFLEINDTIKYAINGTDSDDQQRVKMVKALKIGLVRYIARTKISDQMTVSFTKPQTKENVAEDDWDYWVFRLSMNGNINEDNNYNSYSIYSSLSANRTTEDLKLSFSLSNNYNENKYSSESYSYRDISRSQNASASLVKAIDDNWSWGVWGNANSSTYNNIDYAFSFSPGIEYNVFPYSASNERQLRIDYKISNITNKYVEETFYFKTKENLWKHSLETSLSLIKQWGSVSFGVSAENYLNDFKNIGYGIYSSASLRLFKGFSLNFFGNYYSTGKQITLPLEGATLEEVLLRRRQLETKYSFYAYFGLSYSFGSIFNNAVNPRFGGGGGSTMIITSD